LNLTSARKPLKIGMVGVGYIGQVSHLANYMEVEGCEVRAIADIRPELRAAVQGYYDISESYETHLDLLKKADIDAVVIVTRRHHTGPIARDCMLAGKHVFTEKPMAATLKQAKELVDVSRERNVHYTIGYMKRHDAGVAQAKSILADLIGKGELGPVSFVRAHCFQGHHFYDLVDAVGLGEGRPEGLDSWGAAPEWLPENYHRAYDDFMNVCTHDINLLRFLFDETPQASHLHYREGAGGVAMLDFENFPAVLEFGHMEHRGWDESVDVYFQRGRLRITLPPPLMKGRPAMVEIFRGGEQCEIERQTIENSWAFRRQADAFVQELREETPSLASGKDSLEDIRLAEDLWKGFAH
jgi:predicted dehydrogenase